MSPARSRDLLPLPLPFPGAGTLCAASHPSRSMRRRLRSTGLWQQLSNDAVTCLNELDGSRGICDQFCTSAQSDATSRIVAACRDLGKPPCNLTPAGAFVELCGSAPPYLTDDGGPAPYCREALSLPSVGGVPASCEANLPAEVRDQLVGENPSMLRCPADA